MKIEINKIIWSKKKEEELPSLLCQLPKWRLEKALSYRFNIDKYLCAESFLLLQKMLVEEYKLETIPIFSYKTNGKPYFKEYPNIHFNISHCKSGVACVISDKPVGIDIEEFFFDKDVAEKILSKEELKIVQNSTNPEHEFIKFWTQKESYLKLTGIGITDDMKNILNNTKNNIEFKTYIDNNFITTVAFESI